MTDDKQMSGNIGDSNLIKLRIARERAISTENESFVNAVAARIHSNYEAILIEDQRWPDVAAILRQERNTNAMGVLAPDYYQRCAKRLIEGGFVKQDE